MKLNVQQMKMILQYDAYVHEKNTIWIEFY